MSKKRGYEAKPRNTNLRKRKSIVLLAAEGKNKTETLYFKSIPSATHVIRFAPGNYTDPVNMVHTLRKEFDDLGLDLQLGDIAYCLVDSDVDPRKDKQLEKADAVAGEEVKVIVSNPCFEIWYLCHFLASTKQYASSNEVLKALQQYIPEYSKSMKGLWDRIGDKTKTAISNAIILENKCLEQSLKPHTTAFMPSTEVYKILELLFPREKHTPALMESIVAENEEAFKELAK